MGETADLACLVRDARSGEPHATEALYRHEFPRLVSICGAYATSRAAAEDLAQDTFIKALTRLPQLRDDRAWRGWVTRIARNAAMDVQRRSHLTELRGDLSDLAPPSPVADNPSLDRLIQAWSRLPRDDQRVLRMTVLEDRDATEVGAAMDLNRDAVYQRVSRAKTKLRAALGPRWT